MTAPGPGFSGAIKPAGVFKRLILPGLAFKAVVIGGGYATGRELAEFFLPQGPRGGLLAMLLATALWSLVCVLTFVLARRWQTLDYRAFFEALLGPGATIFEIAYLLFLVLILAVFGAAAGAIGAAVFGWPSLVGTFLLVFGILTVASFGNSSVERLFKWASIVLYAVYALFAVLALTRFGDRISAHLALTTIAPAWPVGGLTYAGYNIIGAVVILPVVRHMTSDRDAVVAGLVAGPLAMIPGLLFFLAMLAFYPEIGAATLPSDYLLTRLNLPILHLLFQTMIFVALLESGTGIVHAVNERIANARGADRHDRRWRAMVAAILLLGSIFLATRFGLVALIANGYALLAYVLLAIYVLPLVTFGAWRIWRENARG